MAAMEMEWRVTSGLILQLGAQYSVVDASGHSRTRVTYRADGALREVTVGDTPYNCRPRLSGKVGRLANKHDNEVVGYDAFAPGTPDPPACIIQLARRGSIVFPGREIYFFSITWSKRSDLLVEITSEHGQV